MRLKRLSVYSSYKAESSLDIGQDSRTTWERRQFVMFRVPLTSISGSPTARRRASKINAWKQIMAAVQSFSGLENHASQAKNVSIEIAHHQTSQCVPGSTQLSKRRGAVPDSRPSIMRCQRDCRTPRTSPIFAPPVKIFDRPESLSLQPSASRRQTWLHIYSCSDQDHYLHCAIVT